MGQRINSNFVSSVGNTYTPVEKEEGPEGGLKESFSWKKVFESWKNGGANISYKDENGIDKTVTLADYYKQYGVSVAA
jgi:hypothetical protein